ncbi:SDR family NAD(P)-dependent oxidoreductase [Novosphingobium resinovorum]|uniref:Short-chain dehydrogenase/reductase SDR n=1 Tax=Novosphingobium resinovorum TaxID=158500 RepID=A0A1D8AFS9_9SPHN|nr:SDR family oxidoreductase [Novosphingobium resinovorum]AOR80972.1 hypothetical protein BES08_27255 [Novosphingobium resinovorum]
MTGRLEDRVAIVTGASSGIGRAIVERFCSEGAKVLAVDLDAAKLAAAHQAGETLELLAQDIAAPGAAEGIVRRAMEAFGRLDILVNNAGVCLHQPMDQTTDDNWDRTMAVNVTAMFRLCRAAIPALRESGRGRIINTSSIMGHQATVELGAYNASKHAVAGLTKTLALELGTDGTTANYILPGAVRTGMTQPWIDGNPALETAYADLGVMGRMGEPRELASAFLFLASDDASFVTGHGLAVDGGALARVH